MTHCPVCGLSRFFGLDDIDIRNPTRQKEIAKSVFSKLKPKVVFRYFPLTHLLRLIFQCKALSAHLGYAELNQERFKQTEDINDVHMGTNWDRLCQHFPLFTDTDKPFNTEQAEQEIKACEATFQSNKAYFHTHHLHPPIGEPTLTEEELNRAIAQCDRRIGFVLYADGASLSTWIKNNRFSFTPLILSILNLPIKIRNQHLLTVGLCPINMKDIRIFLGICHANHTHVQYIYIDLCICVFVCLIRAVA